jgi:hypothetical protein
MGDLLLDLQNWRMAGPGGFRRLPDGSIESHGGSGLLWYAAVSYDDFHLSVEWRISHETDNSGVFVRIPPLSGSPAPAIERGYEVQIDERGINPAAARQNDPLHLTGAVYKLAPALARASHGIGEWNRFEITAKDFEIGVTLNGVEVSRLTHALRRRGGHVALQNHHEGSAVQFRRLEVVAL